MPIVYILTNPVMPGLVKIGKTDVSIEQRVSELSRASGVPVPFEIVFAAEVDDSAGWELALHSAFQEARINPKREFFRLHPDRPLAILRKAHIVKEVTPTEDVVDTPEEGEALQEERERNSRFSFRDVDIQIGAQLQSSLDDNIYSEVVSDSQVRLRGEICSLSGVALMVAREKGLRSTSLRGPAYWKYEGRTLVDIRIAKQSADLRSML